MNALSKVLLIEDDPRTRKELVMHLKSRLPVDVVLPRDISLPSISEAISLHPEISILLVDLILQSDGGDFEHCAPFISELRRRSHDKRIIGYSHILKAGQRRDVIAAGADDYVAYVDVYDAVVARVYFQSFLADLDFQRSPYSVILNGLGAGVSVQDPDTWEVLYTNPANLCFVGKDIGAVRGRKCWQVYHNFMHRECPCTTCVAANKVTSQYSTTATPDKGMILPIRGVLEKVRVVAALIPADLYGYPKQLVAEVSQKVEGWKDEPAETRLREVLRDLWAMTRESDTSGPCEDVALYYSVKTKLKRVNCKEGDNVRGLFDSVTGLAPANLGSFPWPTCDTGTYWVHAWPKTGYSSYIETHGYDTGNDSSGEVCLVYICQSEEIKNEKLFQCDLRPYWDFIVSEFHRGLEARLERRRMAIGKAIVEYRSNLTDANKESGSEFSENALISAFAGLAHKGLGAISSHYRKIDGKGRRLLLVGPREGVYASLAREERNLYEETVGSAWAFANGDTNVDTLLTFETISKGLARLPSECQKLRLEEIAASINVPIRVSGHLWGVVSFQFSNDYLTSDEGVENVRAMAEQLGAALTIAETKVRYGKLMEMYTEIQNKIHEGAELEWLPNAIEYILGLSDMTGVGLYGQDVASNKFVLQYSLLKDSDLLMPNSLPVDCVGKVLVRDEKVCSTIGCFRAKSDGILAPNMKLGVCMPVDASYMLVGLSATDAAQNNQLMTVFEHGSRLVRNGLTVEAYRQGQRARMENLRTANAYGHLLLSGQKQEIMIIAYGLLCLAIAREVCDRLYIYWADNGRACCFEFSPSCMDLADVLRQDLLLRNWASSIPSTTWAWRVQNRCVESAINMYSATARVTGTVGDISAIDSSVCQSVPDMPEYVIAVTASDQTKLFTFFRNKQQCAFPEEVREALKLMSEMLSLQFERRSQRDLMDQIVRGKAYAWRTKSVLLAERVSKIAYRYHICDDALAELKEAVEFFRRSGDVSAKVSRIELVGIQSENVSLNKVLRDCVRFVDDKRISMELSSFDYPITGDSKRIGDVLLELIANARQFTPCYEKGGRIVVRVLFDPESAVLEVEDNGAGVSPEIEARLFEAFFSEPPGRVGMGLYYCRKVMERHGGEVIFDRSRSRGSVFKLVFPRKAR